MSVPSCTLTHTSHTYGQSTNARASITLGSRSAGGGKGGLPPRRRRRRSPPPPALPPPPPPPPPRRHSHCTGPRRARSASPSLAFAARATAAAAAASPPPQSDRAPRALVSCRCRLPLRQPAAARAAALFATCTAALVHSHRAAPGAPSLLPPLPPPRPAERPRATAVERPCAARARLSCRGVTLGRDRLGGTTSPVAWKRLRILRCVLMPTWSASRTCQSGWFR